MGSFISLIHPSRSRPQQANATIRNWLAKSNDQSSIEYILSIDRSDPHLSRYKAIGIENGIYVATNNNKSAIEAINKAAKVSTANMIVVCSDDFDAPHHWDLKLLEALEGKEDYIVKTKDGIQPTLITLPILDRSYYNRFGYIYEPGYFHLFSDQEFTAVGHLLGKVVTLDLEFPHLHYSTGKSKKDSLNVKNDKTWGQGKKHFNNRLKTNFGIENPVMNYSEIKWQ